MMIKVEVIKIYYYAPSKGYAVLLKEIDGQRSIPIIVSSLAAQSISLAKEGNILPRPMTHDLLYNVIVDLKAEVKRIIISKLEQRTFYSKIILDSNYNGISEIDARPSDSIAIGLRFNAPILINTELIDNFIKNNIVIEESNKNIINETLISKNNSSIINLTHALKSAIDREDYESAAKLRDRIQYINKESKNI